MSLTRQEIKQMIISNITDYAMQFKSADLKDLEKIFEHIYEIIQQIEQINSRLSILENKQPEFKGGWGVKNPENIAEKLKVILENNFVNISTICFHKI